MISNFLKRLRGFNQFIITNGINDYSINLAAGMITQKSFGDGEYVFKVGDLSTCFYGIIRGNVDIIIEYEIEIKEKIIDEDEIYLVKKEKVKKVLVLKEGAVFGDYGLINNETRSASAIAVGNIDLFIVSKLCFNDCFKKPLQAADKNRRIFLIKVFPELLRLSEKSLNFFYKKLIYKVSLLLTFHSITITGIYFIKREQKRIKFI